MKLFTSIYPEQPDYNTWCKEFNFGLMYQKGQEIHYELKEEKTYTFTNYIIDLWSGTLKYIIKNMR